MDSQEEIRGELQEVFGKKKSHKKILGVIVLFGLSAAIIALFYPNVMAGFSLPQMPLFSGIKAEDVAFISQSDLDMQEKIGNATGYDWTSILESNGGQKSKVAALMLLANEVSVLDDQFDFVNRSVGITRQEFSSLNLKRMNASDTSKENVLKLIGSMKAVEKFFESKNLTSARIRVNRLDFLHGFFSRYGLPEGDLTFEEGEIFGDMLGFSVDDSNRAVALAIIRYNLFVESI